MQSPQDIEKALQAQFPELGVTVKAAEHVLCMVFSIGEKGYMIHTPSTIPFEWHEPEWWLHRFADEIKRKIQP